MRTAKPFRVLAIVALACLGQVSPTWGHEPFISQVEKLILPDGQTGEARLLHGDGILAPNPIRLLIVDANGRLLARSHRSEMMVLSCAHNNCRAFDVGRGQVVEINSSTFREGPVIPYYGEKLWAIEDGEESWGFQVRPASLTEQVEGELILAKRLSPLLVLLFAAGTLIAFSGFVIARRRPKPTGLDVFKILLALMLIAFAGFISLILWAVSPVTGYMLLGSMGAGVAVAFVVRHLGRKIKPPLPSPAV